MKKLPLRVVKGGFEPADKYTTEHLKARKYAIGDIIFAHITKPRNPGFHRLVHRFGELVAQNIEDFEGMNAHAVLKRLQLEASIGCDEVALNFPGIGPCNYRIPKSLSYESMKQEEFQDIYSGFCKYIVKKYWHGLSEDKITEMAEMIDDNI